MTFQECDQKRMEEVLELYGEPISVYTLQEAVEDGFMADVTAQQSVYHCPVYISVGVLDVIEHAANMTATGNSFKGVLHDICWVSFVKFRNRAASFSEFFLVKIVGAGPKPHQVIKCTRNSEGVTFCLPEEG